MLSYRLKVVGQETKDIGKLARMMQVHESQQSATIVSTIAILVGSKLDNSIDAKFREAIGDVILWNIPVIKNKKDWPLNDFTGTKAPK